MPPLLSGSRANELEARLRAAVRIGDADPAVALAFLRAEGRPTDIDALVADENEKSELAQKRALDAYAAITLARGAIGATIDGQPEALLRDSLHEHPRPPAPVGAPATPVDRIMQPLQKRIAQVCDSFPKSLPGA